MHFIHIILADNVDIDQFAEKLGSDYCEVREKIDIRKLDRRRLPKWIEEFNLDKLIKEAKEKGKSFIYFLDCHV